LGEAVLYGIPGSHAVRTGELMLQHKGVAYRRKDLRPGLHRPIVRLLLRFSGDRVPAVRFADGSRGQGTRALARVLDEKVPEPRLVPDDPRVLEAERWGDEVLQQWARRVVVAAGVRNPDLLRGRGGEGRLGPLLAPGARRRRMVARGVVLAFGVTKEQAQEDDRMTGELLDHIDGLIADGVLNGPQFNCVDLQVASSLALAEYRLDIAPQIERRPAAELLERVLPAS
jgi:glutathione S-transferase